MEPGESRLNEFGSNVRNALRGEGEGDAAQAIRAAREALLDRAAAGNLRPRAGWFRGHGAAAKSGRAGRVFLVLGFALGATAAVASLVVGLRSPLSFSVGPNATPGRLGDLVEAPAAEPLGVQFSDDSSIVVGASSRMRVLTVEPVGAQVLVESGTADVAITHRVRRRTHWRFEAGPFHVLVTGTRFRVGWSPKDQTFALDLREGAVVVSGACLPGERTVSAGESMRLSCAPPAQAASAPSSTASAPVAAAVAAPARVAPPPTEAPAVERAPSSTVRPARPAADWRQLVKAGEYAEALRAVERAGFDRACATATDAELLALADAARLSGNPTRAQSALGTLRRRFPRSDASATAAFALGRISFEQGHAYDAAVRWFSTYVTERPSGPLIGDAVGRLMEARQRGGDRAGARADAERYLHRFPEGPYASVARVILAE
jgi:TolA-binding protein